MVSLCCALSCLVSRWFVRVDTGAKALLSVHHGRSGHQEACRRGVYCPSLEFWKHLVSLVFSVVTRALFASWVRHESRLPPGPQRECMSCVPLSVLVRLCVGCFRA